MGKLCSDWLQTFIYEILAAFSGKINSDMFSAVFLKRVSMERQQFSFFNIWQSRLRLDLCVHTRIIDRVDRQKYNISKIKHGFQINRYRKQQNMENIILVIENAILGKYYSQPAKTRAVYESIDGPADNLPNLDGLRGNH